MLRLFINKVSVLGYFPLPEEKDMENSQEVIEKLSCYYRNPVSNTIVIRIT